MDAPTTFKFPASGSQPLQTLSPERVNSTRPASSISTTTTNKTTETSESDSQDASQYSPTRKAKANLFADFNPNARTPVDKVSGFALPQSPSLPEIHALRSHGRTNSDVQGLVKRFEHLDVRDKDAESAERRKRHDAELRRAQIAREEAESDVRRLREEMRQLKEESNEGRERERKVARRLDVVMVSFRHNKAQEEKSRPLTTSQEELTTAKEAHASQSSVYEKELRKARKEAFKSSSAVLKLQEELKSTRNSIRITQSGLDLEKQKVQRKEQERFEMEYRLIPLQEQVDKLQQKLRVSEEEREALKRNIQEGEVARIAAEGMIALPVSQDMDLDLLSSPRKQASPLKRALFNSLEEDKENMGSVPKIPSENRRLADQLEQEKIRREQAEEMVDFMRVECMFRCCGCQSSRLGHQFTLELDAELAAGVDRVRSGMEGILTPASTVGDQDQMDAQSETIMENELVEKVAGIQIEVAPEPEATAKHLAAHTADDHDIDRSHTFAAESPSQIRSPDDQLHEEAEKALQASPSHEPPPAWIAPQTSAPSDMPPAEPSTPSNTQQNPFRTQPSIRTVTTTTTVPMHFTPSAKATYPPVFDEEDAENIPHTPTSAASGQATFDRAAALAAIEYRRGRAKSLANGHATPRKQMLEGVNLGGRRDISAPALGQKGASAVKSAAGAAVGTRSVRGTR